MSGGPECNSCQVSFERSSTGERVYPVITLCLFEHVGFSLLETALAVLTARGIMSALRLQFC